MMGWINDEGEFNEETFGADVMSLPPRYDQLFVDLQLLLVGWKGRVIQVFTSPSIFSSVAETITEESIGTCAAKMMEEWGEDSLMDK